MQGVICKKQDLLPRYKNGARSIRRGSFFTTSTKKLVVYVLLLLAAYSSLRIVGFGIRHSGTRYDLKAEVYVPASQTEDGNAMTAVDALSIPKGSFNNDVAMQQEVENLNKNTDENKKALSSSNKKAAYVDESSSGKGNTFKAMKHDEEGGESSKHLKGQGSYKKEAT